MLGGRGDVKRQHIFQFMGQATQFVVAAGCGISLERMDGAPHLAQDIRVLRVLFQLQPFFIERLQQFRCGLKEEFAQLRGAVVREETHPFTSMRWYAVPLFWWTIRYLSERPKRLSACPMNKYPSEFRQR